MEMFINEIVFKMFLLAPLYQHDVNGLRIIVRKCLIYHREQNHLKSRHWYESFEAFGGWHIKVKLIQYIVKSIKKMIMEKMLLFDWL